MADAWFATQKTDNTTSTIEQVASIVNAYTTPTIIEEEKHTTTFKKANLKF